MKLPAHREAGFDLVDFRITSINDFRSRNDDTVKNFGPDFCVFILF
jgi:hypothetical protein